MSPGAPQIEPFDASECAAVDAPLQQLLGEHLAVEDVSAGDAEARLELTGAECKPLDDSVGKPRAREREAVDGGVRRGLGVRVGGKALAEEREHVPPLGREG